MEKGEKNKHGKRKLFFSQKTFSKMHSIRNAQSVSNDHHSFATKDE